MASAHADGSAVEKLYGKGTGSPALRPASRGREFR
jgi:hypothetical protein